MKITRIDVFQIQLPYSGGIYRLSGGRTFEQFDATIVRIETDNGLEGWGESTPFGANFIAAHARGVRAGLEEICPRLIGLDPRCFDRTYEVMNRALAGHAHAKTPVDVACWDLFGKSVGMPVCDLLGGHTDLRMPLISSIHAAEPEDMRRRVSEHRSQGYRGHSIKIGATEAEGGPALDAERIASSLADRQQGEFFLVDANGGLTVEHALRMLRLIPQGLDFVLEAPCATSLECASLRRRTNVPIMMDELANSDASIVQIVSDGLADGIGLKISKAGGLTPGRRQRDICIAAGLTMSVQDTVGSEIAFSAIVHLGQTVPERYLNCVLDCRGMVTTIVADFEVNISDEGVLAPKGPGLGVFPKLSLLGAPIATYR